MIKIFWYLLRTDLMLLTQTLKDKIINLSIFGISVLVVSSYMLQGFGISKEFGTFQAASVIITAIGFELFGQLFAVVADIDGNKHIDYYLTLPISNKLILMKMVVLYTINGLVLAIFMLLISKLLLFHKFRSLQINYLYVLITLLTSSIFFGVFTLFLVTLVKNVEKVENVMMRILFPMWFWGCFQFSWKIAYSITPAIAYLSLISPYTFTTEAIRSAMFGPNEYIPFWVNIFTLWGMTVFISILGYTRLKRKLDFI